MMAVDEIMFEKMWAFIAPDGSVQPSTLAADLPECFALMKVMHKAGIGKSPNAMIREGFRIAPVRVTIIQDGPIDEQSNLALAAPKGGIKPKLN